MNELVTVDTICAEKSCSTGDCIDSCMCCGAPLCGMHAQEQTGFCTPCLNAPDFPQRMYDDGQAESHAERQRQLVEFIDYGL